MTANTHWILLRAAARLFTSGLCAALWLPAAHAQNASPPAPLEVAMPARGMVAGEADPRGFDPVTPAAGTSSSNGVSVTVPNGSLSVAVDDLRLRSTAGEVRWVRTWDGLEWKFNSHWESLSQSFKNLTGSQTADTTGGTLGAPADGSATVSTASSSGAGSGCWVWVDEDWQPSVGTTVINGVPQAGPMLPGRMTPFNRLMGEASLDYPEPVRVNVDFANLCAGSMSAAAAVDTEAIRRINELYLGDGGRYAFSNRSVLEKRAVKGLPALGAAALEAALASGRIVPAPATNDKGFRWIDRGGDWIDYNTQGQVVAWGDRNDNTIWLVRDTEGVLRGVVDATGRVLYSLHYTGALLTEVKDYPVTGNSQDLPGRSVKYEYDSLNRLTRVTDVRGNDTRYEYDGRNRIVKITDPEGRAEQIAYAGDMVSKRTAPDGGVTDYAFEYDDTNKQFISKMTGPETAAGRRVEDFTHNRVGQLVRRIVNGRTEEEVRYDTGARVTIETNARGFTTRTTKNEFDQVIEIVHPDGSTTKRAYSALHLEQTEETDEAGFKTQFQHDSRGNLIKKIEAAGTTEERITEYEVNALGQNSKVTQKGRMEPNGIFTPDATWQFEYDSLGQIKKTTDPEGKSRQHLYDRAGNLVSSTDPRGHAGRYDVDASGNLLRVTDALGRVRSYSYDKVGNQVTYTDARSKSTLHAYDAMNRRNQTTNPVGGSRKAQYNGYGLVVAEADEDGRTHQTEFDNFLRIVKQIDGLGNTTEFAYQISDGSVTGRPGSLADPTEVNYPTFAQQTRFDARERPTSQTLRHTNSQGAESLASTTTYDKRGLVTSETDPKGHTRTHNYDAFGQRTVTTDSLGGKTTSLYDIRGNLLQLTNANDGVYRFEYDRNNRIVKQSLPLGQTSSFSYDAAGNLAERTDPKGQRFAYTYDAANRLVELKQFAADARLLRTITQEWDASDNRIAWTDTDLTRPSGQQTTRGTATFDDASRKTGEVVTYPTPSGGTYELGYGVAYSLAGKKTQLTWPDGTTFGYGYSAHGELESVSVPGEGTLKLSQFKWTAPEQTMLPGGVTQNRSYDGLLGLEGLKVKTPGQQTVLEVANAYGKLREVTSSRRTDSVGSVSSTRSSSYLYDADNRLTQATIDTGGQFGTHTETFILDLLGNRTEHTREPGAWTYDANNRLTQRGTGSDAVAYQYDDAGNLVRKTEPGNKVTQYVYDAMNRLVEVRTGSDELVARYGYDPLDRRLWKEQYRDASGHALPAGRRTYYLYADEGLLAEAEQAITLHADNSVSSSTAPALSAQYGLRPDAEFTTGVLFVKSRNSNGQEVVAYFHHDQLDTPLQATDKTGAVVWSATYDPFGAATITTPAATVDKPMIASRLRLPGQYSDDETGLHYNLRRYYDPATGRYTSEDPIGLDGGLNTYLYANGNPLLFTDPRGEHPVAVAIALARIIAILCARYPRICKELVKCAANPSRCKDRFCKPGLFGKGRQRPVHYVCDNIPPINEATDTCTGAAIKCGLVGLCVGLREIETAICFGGKPHKGPKDVPTEEAKKRLEKCTAATARVCKRCSQ